MNLNTKSIQHFECRTLCRHSICRICFNSKTPKPGNVGFTTYTNDKTRELNRFADGKSTQSLIGLKRSLNTRSRTAAEPAFGTTTGTYAMAYGITRSSVK